MEQNNKESGCYIPGGYVMIARKILESDFMDKPPLWHKLWLFMVVRATRKPYKGLKQGQFLTSIAEMRDVCSHKVGYRKVTPTGDQIRKAYEGFTKAAMITTTKTTRGLLITILNYPKYQDPKSYEAHSEGHNERLAKAARRPLLYNKQEEQDEQNKKPLSQTCDETVDEPIEKPIKGNVPKAYHAGFEMFWQAYPKRQGRRNGKRTAFGAWWRLIRDGIVSQELLIERITTLAPTYGDYPKDPATWLRSYGWQDEFDADDNTGRSRVQSSLSVLKYDGPDKYKAYCSKHGLPIDMAAIAQHMPTGGNHGLRKFR